MKNLRFLVPVGLFVAFSGAHYMATQGNKSRIQLMVAQEAGSVREPFTASLAESTTILVDDPDAEWLKAFVQREDLGAVVGQPLKRSLQPGRLIQFSDFREPRVGLTLLEEGNVGLQLEINVDIVPGHIWVGSYVGFVILKRAGDEVVETMLREPFRVISIGEFREAERGAEEVTARHKWTHITIEAKRNPDGTLEDRFQELLLASNGYENLQISNLIILPDQDR